MPPRQCLPTDDAFQTSPREGFEWDRERRVRREGTVNTHRYLIVIVSVWKVIRRPFARCLDTLHAWRQCRHTWGQLRSLLSLDERPLADIGQSRTHLRWEVSRPFWKPLAPACEEHPPHNTWGSATSVTPSTRVALQYRLDVQSLAMLPRFSLSSCVAGIGPLITAPSSCIGSTSLVS